MDKTICCILQDAKTRTIPIYRIARVANVGEYVNNQAGGKYQSTGVLSPTFLIDNGMIIH